MNMDYVTWIGPVKLLNCRHSVFYRALAFRASGICFSDNRLSGKPALAMQLNFLKTTGVCARRLWKLLILPWEFLWWQFLLALSKTFYTKPVLLRLSCFVCVWCVVTSQSAQHNGGVAYTEVKSCSLKEQKSWQCTRAQGPTQIMIHSWPFHRKDKETDRTHRKDQYKFYQPPFLF